MCFQTSVGKMGAVEDVKYKVGGKQFGKTLFVTQTKGLNTKFYFLSASNKGLITMKKKKGSYN